MPPRPIVIDTDPGVDDAIAILLALASPELELVAVHTVAGNCPLADATGNALRVLELAGRADIPVHAGCPRPLLREQIFGKFHGRGGLGGTVLPAPRQGVAPGHAAQRLIEVSHAARATGRPLTVCPIGPLTNLAAAIALDPTVAAAWDKVVVMGGGFRVPGNRTPYAEFNILADPHAARMVLNSGADIVMMPLDLTHQAMATPARIERLRAAGGRIAAAVVELLTFWDRGDIERFGEPGGPLHDPTVIGYLLAPELFQGKRVHVDVDCETPERYGHMVADWYGQTDRPANATVMTKLDAEGFFALLTRRLAALE
ncbi:nucleoside hydrolase [Limobrevibacterium gyesilva]|uniref:Nucleoside hydrolase n=1 Tax=Limobrevibacterium gyesilva TaxID=2991712 RepID=A0AA42CKG1_9PROT|nr:nucleoside hydrolase [Limobrevibacterium gyesilva]MCW3477872.1 nucleoside hydrolase [Limobrevibacterium gyesilva]